MQFQLEPPEIAIGVLVEPHVLGELFRIKAPALGIGGEAAKATEGRHISQFGLDRALEVMARQAFMIEQCLDLEERHVGHVVEIGIIGARTRSIG